MHYLELSLIKLIYDLANKCKNTYIKSKYYFRLLQIDNKYFDNKMMRQDYLEVRCVED